MTEDLIPINDSSVSDKLNRFFNRHYPDIYFMDTETSGFNGEVIEYSILDLTGNSGLRSRCKPIIHFIDKGASDCHGITLPDLQKENYFIQDLDRIMDFMNGGEGAIVMYNSDFDCRMMKNSLSFSEKNFNKIKNKISDNNNPLRNLEFYKKKADKLFGMETLCLMKTVSEYNKIIGKNGKWLKLSKAAEQFGVQVDESMLHGSEYDTSLTREIFISLGSKICDDSFEMNIRYISNP